MFDNNVIKHKFSIFLRYRTIRIKKLSNNCTNRHYFTFITFPVLFENLKKHASVK